MIKDSVATVYGQNRETKVAERALFNIGATGGTANDTIIGGSNYNYTNINAASGSISINGSAAGTNNTIVFEEFASSDASIYNNMDGSATYMFGSGANALNVTIANSAETTIHFGH